MNFIVGLLILAVALVGFYYLAKAGAFADFNSIFTDINNGFVMSYDGDTNPHSAYYQFVRIRFVSLVSGDAPSGAVYLVAHPKNGGVTATGWTLKTNKGTFTIPKVDNKYSPSVAGVPPENIFLRDGDRITIYSGTPPVGHSNERVTQSEYNLWFGNFLASEHGTITLRDDKGKEVDQYTY